MRSGFIPGPARRNALALAFASAAALGTAATSYGLGLDGFEDAPDGAPEPDTVLTAVEGIGNTTGTGALRVEVPNGVGVFWGPMTPNVRDLLAAGATSFAYDMTLTNVELNGGSYGGGADDSFNGFAQNNELAVVIATETGSFTQRNFTAGGAADSLNQNAQWNGVDGTRRVSWNLNNFTPGGTSIADFLAANPNATDARIWMVTQGGDTNGSVGPMRFYFDNVTLTLPRGEVRIGDFEPVPEPSGLALLGLAVPALALRRRRRA